MIRPEELRIGNWMYCQGEIRPIYAISSYIFAQYGTKNDVYTCGIDELEPIPLTEEILLKCGFSRADGYYYIKCDRKHITFSLPVITHWIKKPFHTEIGSPHSVKYPHIRFLHQLQNLYFALTGAELEVKL